MTIRKTKKTRRRGALAQKLRCPDCARVSSIENLTDATMTFEPFGTFLECPRCTVGSPLKAWRVVGGRK